MADEEKDVIELDEDDDFYIEDDEDTPSEQAKPQKKEVPPSDFEALLNKKLEASAKHQQELTKAYVDKRIEKVAKRVIANTSSIEDLNTRMIAVEKALQTPNPNASAKPVEKHGIIDVTFGTVGNILHGVVDTVAFVAESAVDLVTLGKARRPQGK